MEGMHDVQMNMTDKICIASSRRECDVSINKKE